MRKRIEVNVVAFQDGDLWVAQCVEYDIAAFAKSLPELPRAFERAVAANVCVNVDIGRNALDGIPAAPERFRHLFEESDIALTKIGKELPPSSSPVKIRDVRVTEAA